MAVSVTCRGRGGPGLGLRGWSGPGLHFEKVGKEGRGPGPWPTRAPASTRVWAMVPGSPSGQGRGPGSGQGRQESRSDRFTGVGLCLQVGGPGTERAKLW